MEAEGIEQAPWYEAIDANLPLEQGDVLRACPFPVIEGDLPTTEAEARLFVPVVGFDILDIIILSQSCDLARQAGKDPRIKDVVVCPAWEVEDLRTFYPQIDQGGYAAQIIRGQVPLWHALAPSALLELERSHTFLQFNRILTMPLTQVEAIARQQIRRLRLRSPWREHMSYAAGMVFSRPVIPTPAPIPPKPFAK